jgi:hypothetical protein
MSVIVRRVAAIPVRLSSDTWIRIVDLLAAENTEPRAELLRVSGIAASLIARETMKLSAIIVSGKGPQIRIYCVYGEWAIEGSDVNEATLPASPLDSGEWEMSLPCPADDLPWIQASFKALSSRISARNEEDHSLVECEDQATTKPAAAINKESFLRP